MRPEYKRQGQHFNGYPSEGKDRLWRPRPQEYHRSQHQQPTRHEQQKSSYLHEIDTAPRST
jgi:hypothetical protein